jgi:RNA polymerase sigma-70 factor (ECF subfamily)
MPNHDAFQVARMLRTARKENAHPDPALDQLVQQYYPAIYRLALSILDDPDEAEDAAQETFISAHRSLAEFRGDSKLKTWLFSIAFNTCRGRLRKRRVQAVLHTTLQALHLLKNQPISPEQSAIQVEVGQCLWKAVANLDEKHRLPVILRYVHELTIPDIAELLHLSQGTVHSRLHYARQKLYLQVRQLDPNQEAQDESP